MFRFSRFVVVVFALLVLAGCATVPTDDIEIDARGVPGFDPGRYKSYAWLGSAQIVNDPQGEWEPEGFDADAEVRFLIDRELRKRGMLEVMRKPDIALAFIAGVDMEALELKEVPEQEAPVLEKVSKGALAIVFVDPNTMQPVWAAAALGTVKKDRSVYDIRARLDYAVTRMLGMLGK